ncbi:MAG: 3'(2'),5'-bisphosphate nucleotidase CysQ [Eudoraea sp.]|nr:3'(2'),5'-bisphosphate nucleotidase CysQ [Eudoraea sp.]
MLTELQLAIKAAIKAGEAIIQIYSSSTGIEVTNKEDNSPLTAADRKSNEIINSYLDLTGIPIISEENNQINYHTRKYWELCWIVDPLDGTKEFIKRNGEFTVNIALCKEGSPIFGVIYVPVNRELYYGNVEEGKAYKAKLDNEHNLTAKLFSEKDRIFPSKIPGDTFRIVGSRSHMNQETLDYIDLVKGKYNNIEIVTKGSSLKFCLVAEGKAEVYPRYAPTMEWDTAAGQAICNAVGLTVTSRETNESLKYNKKNLLNPHFIVHS